MIRLLKNFIYLQLALIILSITCTTMKGSQKLEYNLVEGRENIYIDPHSEKIGHTWSDGNVWDKSLIQKFCSMLPTDKFFVALDLGAQTGSFSLLAKYFPNSAWHAFEPIKEAVDTLKKNLQLNNIKNVSVYQMAASDFSGKTILRMPGMNEWGLSTIGPNLLRCGVAMEREITCIDLDRFVVTEHIEKVHFMKLDTEGSELAILRGARQMIKRDHPIILMEYNETNMKQCNVRKQEIDDFLTEMGYKWTLVSSEDILCIPVTNQPF